MFRAQGVGAGRGEGFLHPFLDRFDEGLLLRHLGVAGFKRRFEARLRIVGGFAGGVGFGPGGAGLVEFGREMLRARAKTGEFIGLASAAEQHPHRRARRAQRESGAAADRKSGDPVAHSAMILGW